MSADKNQDMHISNEILYQNTLVLTSDQYFHYRKCGECQLARELFLNSSTETFNDNPLEFKIKDS
jgi:hypothetical protein